jgi:uncharacterized protein YjdB
MSDARARTQRHGPLQRSERGRVDAAAGLLALLGVVGATATCEHLDVVAVDVARVEVEPDAQVVPRGEARLYTARAQDAEGRILEGREVVWSTANEAIALVDAEGVVVGVAVGTTDVIALIEGLEGRATVTVGPPTVMTVEITPSAIALRPGEAAKLNARVTGSDGSTLTDRAVTWRSSNESVAEVDASGAVRALAVGSATITATAEGVDDTAVITVALEPVAKVTVTPLSAVLDVNGTVQLSAQLEGADGTDLTGAGRVVGWSSSSADVALDPAIGVSTTATAVAATCPAGEVVCTVTITALVEGVSAAATVSVNKPVASLAVAPPNATLDVGEKVDLEATAHAADGTDVTSAASIAWTASSADVALNGSGPEITATATAASCAAGQVACAVTVTATAGTASAAASLVVRKSATGVAITPSATTLDVGAQATLTASVVAADGTDLTGSSPISWSSGSPDVAIAAASGSATATATAQGATCPAPAGSCDVTITASTPGLPAGSAVVTVRKPVASVQIRNASPLTMPAGTMQGVGATVLAADGSPLGGHSVSWTTADAQIATVATTDPLGATADVSGLALPVCTGDPCTTMIVATVQGTTVMDTLVVNVQKAVASITITLIGTTISGSGLFGPTSITATAAVFAADGTKLSRTVTWSVASGPLLVNPATGDATTVRAPSTFASGRIQASAGGISVLSAQINVLP